MSIRGARPNNRQITPHLLVRDGEAAIDAGATPTLPPCDAFDLRLLYGARGDRYGQFRDPFGHVCAVATVRQELTPEAIEQRMASIGG